jgi:hypothetical protein
MLPDAKHILLEGDKGFALYEDDQKIVTWGPEETESHIQSQLDRRGIESVARRKWRHASFPATIPRPAKT